jgi:hypothetical protein
MFVSLVFLADRSPLRVTIVFPIAIETESLVMAENPTIVNLDNQSSVHINCVVCILRLVALWVSRLADVAITGRDTTSILRPTRHTVCACDFRQATTMRPRPGITPRHSNYKQHRTPHLHTVTL